jgi:hypothetical protein
VELHEEAAAEYDAAFDWYLARSPDAALKFDAEFDRALVEIAQAPQRWVGGPYDTRRFLLRKFPFPFDLPGEVWRRNSDRGGRPHQPETWILERADLKCGSLEFWSVSAAATHVSKTVKRGAPAERMFERELVSESVRCQVEGRGLEERL